MRGHECMTRYALSYLNCICGNAVLIINQHHGIPFNVTGTKSALSADIIGPRK
jgi:hypothetical protein